MRGVEQIPWLYEPIIALGEAFGLKRWREWLTSGARGTVLDLGTGTGRNLPGASKQASLLVAVDPAIENLRAARKRAPSALLVQASAETLPFRDGAFDTVLSSLVLCSVPDPLKGLGEVKRVLRDDGELRAMEHVRATSPGKARWQDFIQPAWTCVSGGCHPNRDTEQNVERAGFVISPEGRRSEQNMRRFVARKQQG